MKAQPRIEACLSKTKSTLVLVTPRDFGAAGHEAAAVLYAALRSTFAQHEVEYMAALCSGGLLSRIEVQCPTEYVARVLMRTIDAMPRLVFRIEAALLVIGVSS